MYYDFSDSSWSSSPSSSSTEGEISSTETDNDLSVNSDLFNGSTSDPLPEFTPEVPAEHRYLGNLEEVKGSAYFESNTIVKLPLLLVNSSFVLVPGQILPFVESDYGENNIVPKAMNCNHVFGVLNVNSNYSPRDSTYQYQYLSGLIGTVAVIFQLRLCEDNTCKVKARGSQRFKVVNVDYDFTLRTVMGRVRILPEINLPNIFEGLQLPSLNRYRSKHRNKCLKVEMSQTRWPVWLYKRYDEVTIKETAIKNTIDRIKEVKLAEDSSALSFQLLKVHPIDTNNSIQALSLNSPIQRLQMINKLLKREGIKFNCTGCYIHIASQKDVVSICTEGPHGTYVNSGGFVHELLTFRRIKNFAPQGNPSSEYSWFPGYSWCILTCSRCYKHLGWEFRSQSNDKKPKVFWGVKNDSVKLTTDLVRNDLEEEDFEDHEDWSTQAEINFSD